MNFFCGVLYLIAGGVSSTLVSQKAQYKDMDQAPASLSKIDTHHSSLTILDCLLKCSENEACKSVVYEGTTCYLYDTLEGTEELMPGQKAVAEIAKDSKYDDTKWKEFRRVTQFAGCSASSKFQQFTCENVCDGSLGTSWMTSYVAEGHWIKLDFIHPHEIHAVDMWTWDGTKGTYQKLTFAFSNNIMIDKHRKCAVSKIGGNFNHFDFEAVTTSYVQITLRNACYPAGWAGCREVAVYIAK